MFEKKWGLKQKKSDIYLGNILGNVRVKMKNDEQKMNNEISQQITSNRLSLNTSCYRTFTKQQALLA